MIKIGEFSQINKITVKTLRLYDKLGLLKPKFIDKFNGFRYYDSDQLLLVQKIISLRQIGFSLSEIASILEDGSDFLKKLEQKEKVVGCEIEVNKEKLSRIKSYINSVKKEKNMNYNVVLKELPEVIVASRRLIIKDYGQLFQAAPEMGEMMKAQGLKCRVPEYCFNIYHDGEYKEKNIDVEICEAVVTAGKETKDLKFKTFGAVKAACILHQGPYENLGRSYGILINWLKDNDYEPADFFRESYIDGCWNKESPNDWLTEIQVPIKKK